MHCDVNSRKFNIRLLALYQLNNRHIEVWSLKTFLLKYTFKSLSPPLFPQFLIIWEKTVSSMPILTHVGQRQSLNKSLGCVLYHPLLLVLFSPWYLTDIKCKEQQGECRRLSHSFKAWAHLDISLKYSSLQRLAKESFSSLAFQAYRVFSPPPTYTRGLFFFLYVCLDF